MAENSLIEWTDDTWNVINGCTVISEGCTNCYAMQLAGTRLKDDRTRKGLTRISGGRPVWNGKVRLVEDILYKPITQTRPRMIFVAAHGDIFHENVPDTWIDRVFATMLLSPQHIFQVLTKRPDRMRQYMSDPWTPLRVAELACEIWQKTSIKVALIAPGDDESKAPPGRRVYLGRWPLQNVWLGTSVENQAAAKARIPHLLATPAAVRWLSAEPLLGPLDLTVIPSRPFGLNLVQHYGLTNSLTGKPIYCPIGLDENGYLTEFLGDTKRIDWIVVGGESGSRARPMHPDWARSLRDQCAAADVPFFFKQWGQFEVVYDRDREDPDWRRCGDFQHRYPKGQWWNLAGGTGFHGERVIYVNPVGKAKAGRLLDGVEHNAMPTVKP